MKVTFDLPSHLLESWQSEPAGPAGRLRRELAFRLYESGQASAGVAAEVAGLSRLAFERALGEAGICRNYGADDLADDLRWAREES